MIAKSSLWSKCWPVLQIISLVSIADNFTLALELPQEKGTLKFVTSLIFEELKQNDILIRILGVCH